MKKLIGKGVTRLIASLLIWLVFMIFLMTAVTQQSVSARIEKSALGVGYSGTLAMVKEAKQRQMERPDLLERQVELLKQLTTAEKSEEAAQGKYQDGWDDALPTLARLSGRYSDCKIAFDATKPVPYGARAVLWRSAKLCAEDHANEQPKAVEEFSKSHFP